MLKNGKFMKNSGLFLSTAKWCFLGLFLGFNVIVVCFWCVWHSSRSVKNACFSQFWVFFWGGFFLFIFGVGRFRCFCVSCVSCVCFWCLCCFCFCFVCFVFVLLLDCFWCWFLFCFCFCFFLLFFSFCFFVLFLFLFFVLFFSFCFFFLFFVVLFFWEGLRVR